MRTKCKKGDGRNVATLSGKGMYRHYCLECARTYHREYERRRRKEPEYKANQYWKNKESKNKRNKKRGQIQRQKDFQFGHGVYVAGNNKFYHPGYFSKGNFTVRIARQKRKYGGIIAGPICHLSEKEAREMERELLHKSVPWKVEGTREDLFYVCEESMKVVNRIISGIEVEMQTELFKMAEASCHS